jgi:nickel-type superoxide dismutase maturation protease
MVTRFHLTQRHGFIGAGLSLVMALAILVGVTRPRRFVVSGPSMLPTLRPGDRLLVARTGTIRAGDLVIVRDPRSLSHLVCKRVVTADARHIVVRGDNPDLSTDSRAFGPVPTEWVIGRVLRRYWPAADARNF